MRSACSARQGADSWRTVLRRPPGSLPTSRRSRIYRSDALPIMMSAWEPGYSDHGADSAMRILSPILLVLILGTAFALAGSRALQLWNALRRAKPPESLFDNLGLRA